MPDFAPALIVLVAFYFFAILFLVNSVRRSNKARQSGQLDQESVAQIVREAIGELPAAETVPSPRTYSAREQTMYVVLLCIGFALIYLALYYAVGIALRLVWSHLPKAQMLLADTSTSLLIPLILGWLVLALVVRWMLLRPSQRKLSDREKNLLSMLQYTQFVAIASASIAMLVIAELAYGWASAFIVYVIYFFAFVVLWRLFSKSVLYFPRYWVYSALMKGEYTQALRNVQQLETKYSQDFAALYNRGTILLFAGQYSEAEKFLRQSLQVGQKMTSFLPEILTNLGYTFLRQGRYEEATRAFEGAIKLNPKAGHACCGLTEVYLFQGKEPQRALDLLVHFMNTTPKREVRDKTVWSSIISDEAWALALLGRHADAQETLRQAFQFTDKSWKPRLASWRFKEGKVFQLQGDRSQAAQSFHRAIQFDPAGAYGQLSRQALEELGGVDK